MALNYGSFKIVLLGANMNSPRFNVTGIPINTQRVDVYRWNGIVGSYNSNSFANGAVIVSGLNTSETLCLFIHFLIHLPQLDLFLLQLLQPQFLLQLLQPLLPLFFPTTSSISTTTTSNSNDATTSSPFVSMAGDTSAELHFLLLVAVFVVLFFTN